MKKDEHKKDNAKRIMTQAGYSMSTKNEFKRGGHVHADEADDKKLVKKMVKKDSLKEKKKEGGFVHGGMPKHRLDKISRQTDKGDTHYAKGGKVKGKGKTQINIMIGSDKSAGQPVPVPVPVGGGAGPMAAPPRPPMAPPGGMPPGAGMPPGGQGAPPRPPMKRGGKVLKDHGSGSGLGRIDKAKSYGGKPIGGKKK